MTFTSNDFSISNQFILVHSEENQGKTEAIC